MYLYVCSNTLFEDAIFSLILGQIESFVRCDKTAVTINIQVEWNEKKNNAGFLVGMTIN